MGELINSNEVHTNVNRRHSCDAWNKCNIQRSVVVNLRSHSSRKLYLRRPLYIINIINCLCFSEPWCGLISSCPVLEGENVTVGCYARYEWLGKFLQYNPRAVMNSSIEILQADGTKVVTVPELHSPPGPPPLEILMTTYTVPTVSAGENVSYTCEIQFIFTDEGYSPNNNYADNTLTWNNCSVIETVPCKCICVLHVTMFMLFSHHKNIL